MCDAEFYVDSADHTDEHLHDGAIEVQTLPTGETTAVWEVDGARSLKSRIAGSPKGLKSKTAGSLSRTAGSRTGWPIRPA